MCPVDEEQFRLEDYKLKVAQLNAHSDRMWTHFNYFVTIEAALVGIFSISNGTQFIKRAPWAALAEFIISIAWWSVGARDRFLWRAARRNVDRAAHALRVDSRRLVGYEEEPVGGYISVGTLDPFADAMHAEALGRHRAWDPRVRLGFWGGAQDSAVGVTIIPMLLPALASVLWWGLFVFLLAHRYSNPSLGLIGVAPFVVAVVWWIALVVLSRVTAVPILWVDDQPEKHTPAISALQRCGISVSCVPIRRSETEKLRERSAAPRAVVIAPAEGTASPTYIATLTSRIAEFANGGHGRAADDVEAAGHRSEQPVPNAQAPASRSPHMQSQHDRKHDIFVLASQDQGALWETLQRESAVTIYTSEQHLVARLVALAPVQSRWNRRSGLDRKGATQPP